MISDARKIEINQLAQDIVNLYTWDKFIEPEKILEKNRVKVIYDKYDSNFEGLTICRDNKFFVHINTKYIPKNSLRSRFTIAHEAGHFFIPEHNIELQHSYHPSKFKPNENNLIEQEANYFASALLMPENHFREFCKGKKFSLEGVGQISKRFAVSRVAVLLRFIEIGNYPLMIAFCQHKKLSWLVRSNDFPYSGAYKSKYGTELPENSVVGEYFRLKNAKYTGVERVTADDWFYLNDDMIDKELNEQCFYSQYGYVISMVWPD